MMGEKEESGSRARDVLVSLAVLLAVALGAALYYATATRATPDANDARLDAIEPELAAAKGELGKLRQDLADVGARSDSRLADLERRVAKLEAARSAPAADAGRLNRPLVIGAPADRFVNELREAVALTDEQAAKVRAILEAMKPEVDAVLTRRLEAREGGMVTFFGDGGALDGLRRQLKEKLAEALTEGQQPAFEKFAAERGLPLIGTHSVMRMAGTGGVNLNTVIRRMEEGAGERPPAAAPPAEPEF
jgi:hypothetical protein